MVFILLLYFTLINILVNVPVLGKTLICSCCAWVTLKHMTLFRRHTVHNQHHNKHMHKDIHYRYNVRIQESHFYKNLTLDSLKTGP